MLKDLVCWSCLVAASAVLVTSNVPQSVPQAKPAAQMVLGSQADRNVHAIVQAIIGQESGWNFRAVNPHSGALGFGQVMPSNVGPWAREAGLGRVNTTEFLASPEIQKKVIYHKIGQYYMAALKKANGDTHIAARMVASAWYSGQFDLYNNTRPQPYNGHIYPSIDYYTSKALASAKRYGLK